MLLDQKGCIAEVSLALSGMGYRPVRLSEIERALKGEVPGPQVFKAAAAEAGKLDATEDSYVNASYRKQLARVMTYRVLEQATQSAQEKMNER